MLNRFIVIFDRPDGPDVSERSFKTASAARRKARATARKEFAAGRGMFGYRVARLVGGVEFKDRHLRRPKARPLS